jgi:hypothetical protein
MIYSVRLEAQKGRLTEGHTEANTRNFANALKNLEVVVELINSRSLFV